MSVTRRARGRGESAGCWAKYRQQWVESSGAEDRAQERRPLLPSSCSRWPGAAGGTVKRYTWVWARTLHTTLHLWGARSLCEKLSIWFIFFCQNTPLYLLESSFHEWKCSNNTCLEHSRFSLGKIVIYCDSDEWFRRKKRPVQVQSKLKSPRKFIESQLSSSQLLLTY